MSVTDEDLLAEFARMKEEARDGAKQGAAADVSNGLQDGSTDTDTLGVVDTARLIEVLKARQDNERIDYSGAVDSKDVNQTISDVYLTSEIELNPQVKASIRDSVKLAMAKSQKDEVAALTDSIIDGWDEQTLQANVQVLEDYYGKLTALKGVLDKQLHEVSSQVRYSTARKELLIDALAHKETEE